MKGYKDDFRIVLINILCSGQKQILDVRINNYKTSNIDITDYKQFVHNT